MIESRKPAAGKTRIRLTREGIAFLIVLFFVALGAVLRSVNLLILLGGMMCAPLLLSWRSKMHVMKHLTVHRNIPRFIHAGELIPVQWVCENSSSRLSLWNLSVRDRARNISGKSKAQIAALKPGPETVISFAQVETEGSAFSSYRTWFENRGTYEFGPAVVGTDFPFGLLTITRELPGTSSIIVAPRLGKLSTSWDQRLESIALGSEASRRKRGVEEDEFYGLRKWRSGDSKRQIHWRSTAKLGTPMIRQHDQKTNRDLGMVLDLRCLPGGEDAAERALSFAATVFTGLAAAVQGQVALSVCGAENLIITDRYHPETVARMMRCLGTVRAVPWDAHTGLAMQTAVADNEGVDNLENESAEDPAGRGDPLPVALIRTAACVSSGTPVFVVSPGSQQERTANWPMDDIRLSSVLPMMQWLQVGSSAFETMFEDANPEAREKLAELKKKWSVHVSR